MAFQGTHPTRAIAVSKWSPDTILVARGSQANIDTTTTTQTSARSMIKAFSISQGMQTAHNYNTGGEVLAWGLRNIVGMTEDPLFGGIVSRPFSPPPLSLPNTPHTDTPSGPSKTKWTTSASTGATSTPTTQPSG